jgi:hypothetical protein
LPEAEFVSVEGAHESILRYDSASLCSLAELIPWNRFLGSLNVYKFGL